MNDLLAQRRLLIRKDSVLHRDMVKARLNPKAYANGGDPWHASYHGDAHDAARYALNAYWQTNPRPSKPQLTDAEAEEKLLAAAFTPKKAAANDRYAGVLPARNIGQPARPYSQATRNFFARR